MEEKMTEAEYVWGRIVERMDELKQQQQPSPAVVASLPVQDNMRMDENNPLLKAAISDREARPWRYYKLDHDTMKKFCEQLADRNDSLEAHLLALQHEMAQAVVHWTTCEDGIHGLDPMPLNKREQWGDYGWVKWVHVKAWAAQLGRLLAPAGETKE